MSRPIPPDSFVGRYLSYMRNQETAEPFDLWSALWCVGAACARATYVNRPRAPVYLNMFVVLIGESGIARKTTSVAMASKVARSTVDCYDDVGFLDAKLTPEALDLMLHDRTEQFGNAQIAIAVPELAVFMGTERYIAHMPTTLTDLYDCPSVRHGGGTVSRGEVFQKNVWIHFISASTPAWLLKTVNPNVVEGGFTSRCYFVISNQPKQRIAWPVASDQDLYQDICEDLRIISVEARTRPPIELRSDALEYFTLWYSERIHSAEAYRQSFESREDAHVLRVAALLSINDGTWQIQPAHIRCAIEELAVIKENAAKIFDVSPIRNRYAIAFDKIRLQLLSAGMDPVPRSRLGLSARASVGAQGFAELLSVMQELGVIQRFDLHNRRGRPVDLIRGTRKLLDEGISEKVLSRFS